MATRCVVVGSTVGLHARPAARLVSELRGLDASVRLRNLTTGTGPVPAASLSRVATLAALRGHQVEISASGPQAPEAIDHLLARGLTGSLLVLIGGLVVSSLPPSAWAPSCAPTTRAPKWRTRSCRSAANS